MKKNKLLVLSLSLLISLGGIVSCSVSTTPTENLTTTETPTEVITTEVVEEVDKPFDAKKVAEWVDYTSQCKFDSSSGRRYLVVESTKSLIDGDTSHFYVSSTDKLTFPETCETYTDGIVKVRYLGIDTPESTGAIEEWGKTASKFNKERLSKAESIIIESNDGNWNLDSTGGRVLAYVWYKLPGETEYRNINLEIMEAGLAYAKTMNSLCYSEVFQKAFNQANERELCVFAKASSMYTFVDSIVKESKGWYFGSTKSNKNMISFSNDKLEGINAVKVYKPNTKGTDTTLASQTDISSGVEKGTEFYLAMEVDGKKQYFNGNIEGGIASTTEDLASAKPVYIEKNASKSGYYSIYTLEENDETHHYVTVNSVNNIDYMERDANFYYGSFQEVTIRGLREHKDDYNGILVRFEGIATKVTGTTLFMQEYDEETGLYYGMQIFLGYSCPATELLKVGNRLSVCTTFQYSETVSMWQCASLEYMMMKPNYEKNTKVISTGNDIVVKEIDSTVLNNTTAVEDYNNISVAETYVGTSVSMTNLKVTKVYTTESSTSSNGALTLTCTDSKGKTVKVRTEVLYNQDGSTVQASQLEGKTIDVKGIVEQYNDSYQVRVYTLSDITIK